MTSTTPIMMQTAATGPAKGLQTAAMQPAQAGGLMGFLTILLQNSGMAAAQNPLAGTQGAAETAQDLAAKISGLLTAGKLDEAALAQLLPSDMAQALTDKLGALQSLLQGGGQADITPTLLGDNAGTGVALTSDLTGASATTAQDEELLNTLAEQLNAIAPGTQDAAATSDDDVITTLLALQGDAVGQQQKTVSPLALHAADASAQALRASPSAAKQAPFAGQAAHDASGEPATGDARGTSPHIDINTDAAARPARQAPAIALPAASLALQLQTAAPVTQNHSAFSGALGSSLGAAGSLLSGDGSLGGGFDHGFGGQHALAGDGSALDGSTADMRLTSAGSFTTYMNAAAKGAGNSATTQMVGMQISRNANAKVDTFTMQLEPADLGALEVRMSFGKDGKVSAKLIAEKPETLSLLQRDSMHLERILQQSGLDVSENALSFDLRDHSQQSMYDGTGASRDDAMYAGRGDHAHRNGNEITAQLAVQAAGYISQTGVNIMV